MKIIKYNKPLDYQTTLAQMQEKVDEVAKGASSELWLLEHEHVYTVGTGEFNDIPNQINDIPVIRVGRGGKITYHGPGQRIVYPIINLKTIYQDKIDVRDYVNRLENIIINFLKKYGITGFTNKDRVGVWVIDRFGNESKVAAIGIRISKSVSFHGISINVNPDLSYFNNITPCGLSGFGVTSLKELGVDIVELNKIDEVLCMEFEKEFLCNPNKLSNKLKTLTTC